MRHIVSHKSPDTDSIVATIVYSKLLNKQGIDAVPVKLGELNKETEFLLDKFDVEAPKTVKKLDEGAKVVLVDHNEPSQSIENLAELNLVGIIDHHKFSINTNTPLYIRSEAIGSTCSIVYKLYKEAGIELEKVDAQLLIAGIISDTLYFRSPTTTEEDRKILEELDKFVQFNSLEDFSLDLFNAKSDLGDLTIVEMVKLDYKVFTFAGKKYGIGVMETTNAQFGLDRKSEVVSTLQQIKKEDNLAGVFFSILDILNEENLTLFPGKFEKDLLVKVFGASIEADVAKLGSVLSRKKEMVPRIQAHLE